MVRSYQFRSTSVPAAHYDEDEILDFTSPGHLSNARAAIDHLNHIGHQSRKQDHIIFNDVGSRTLATDFTPRTTRRHHINPSTATRVFHGGLKGALSRDYSVPSMVDPPTYASNYTFGEGRRMSLAADTAVRHAHREVDRVERELSHHEPQATRKQRSFSFAAPTRTTNLHHEPLLLNHSHTTSATRKNYPGYTYEYESCHPDHMSQPGYSCQTYHTDGGHTNHNYHRGGDHTNHNYHRGGDHTSHNYHRVADHTSSPYNFNVHETLPTKPLYSPLNLIRCLTDTHPTPLHSLSRDPLLMRSRSVHPLESSLLYPTHRTTTHHSTTLPTHHTTTHRSTTLPTHHTILPTHHSTHQTPPLLTRSHSLHRPSKPTHLLPESVSQWYSKPLETVASRYYADSSPTSNLFSPFGSPHHVVTTKATTPVVNGDFNGHYDTTPNYTNHKLDDFDHHINITLTPNYHQHLASSSTYPSLPPRPHSINSSTYLTKATALTAPQSHLHTGLDEPLETHRNVSETRKRVRDVLCKVKHNPHYFD